MTGNQQQEKTVKKHKHMETKQHVSKQPMDRWGNQRGNLKIPGSKWPERHNTKHRGCSKGIYKREIYNNTKTQETMKQ